MRLLNIIIGISFFGSLCGQDTLSLEDAIRLGLQNNYQIQIAGKQVEIAKNNDTWGAAGAYPNIYFGTNLSGAADRYADPALIAIAREELQDSSFSVNTQQSLNLTPSVNMNWTVFNGFNVIINRAKLAYIMQQTEGNAAIVVENTLQSTILAYQFALLQRKALEVLSTVKKLSNDRYKYVLSKKDYGNAVTFDVLQAQTSYLADSANALRQEMNYRNALRNLNLILAEPVDHDFILTGEVMEVKESYVLGDLIAKLESNNKTLQNQYISQEILRKNVEQSKVGLYPMISLSAGFGRTYTGLYGDMEQYLWDNNGFRASGSLTLTYTLSNGGNVRRAMQNARLNEEIGMLQTDQMKQVLYNQLFTVLEQYEIKQQLTEVARARQEAGELNLQIGTEKYRSGAINSFNFRDIQLVHLNAALEYLQAQYNLIDSYTELLRLSGGIITEFDPEGP